MSRVLTILGGRLFDRARDIARREGTRRPSPAPLRPMPPAPRVQGTSFKGLQVGRVLSHTGSSRSSVYTIELADGQIISGKTPRRRGELAGPEFDVRAAPNGTPCLYSIETVNGNPVVVLHSCEEELDSEACAAVPGQGTPESGVVTATEQANTPFRPQTKLVVSFSFDVVSLANTRHGSRLYAFPVGAIDIRSVVADLIISSTAVTNSIEVGFGTVAATGSSGVGLSGTQEDIVPGTNPGSISAGLDYERIWPDSGETRPVLYDGTSAAKELHLNIALVSGSWNASGTIAVTGTIYINWNSAGQFDG